MLRTPRDKFIASAHCATFKNIVMQESFEEAVLASLLELECEQPMHCSPNESADAHNKMAGARRYAEILCNIWAPQNSLKPKPQKGLDYSAGV